jgi:hypothetical protein
MLTCLINTLNKLDKFYSQISTFKTVEEIISNQNEVSSILRSVLNEYIKPKVSVTTLAACSRLLCKTEETFISKSFNQFYVVDPNNFVRAYKGFDNLGGFEKRLFKIQFFPILHTDWINIYRPFIEPNSEIEKRIENSRKIEKQKIVSDYILLSIIFDKIDRLIEGLYVDRKEYRKHYLRIQNGGIIGLTAGLLCSLPIVGNLLVPPNFQRIASMFDSGDKLLIFLEICEDFIIDDISKNDTNLFCVLAHALNNFEMISWKFYDAVEKHSYLLFKLNSFDLNYLFLNIYPKSRIKSTKKIEHYKSKNFTNGFGLDFNDPARLLLSE